MRNYELDSLAVRNDLNTAFCDLLKKLQKSVEYQNYYDGVEELASPEKFDLMDDEILKEKHIINANHQLMIADDCERNVQAIINYIKAIREPAIVYEPFIEKMENQPVGGGSQNVKEFGFFVDGAYTTRKEVVHG